MVIDDWDDDSNPVFATNPDGTYKVKDEKNVTKFPAQDLVKNIKPNSPAISVDTDTGKVTITPPAYEKAGEDTDLASYTITYKDADGNDKTVTATRTVDATSGKTTWTSNGATVDANSGVVTLEIKDLAVGATITAKAKDNGGLEGGTDKLYSDLASKKLETATVNFDSNGGAGNMEKKELNKGCKYILPNNGFTAPENQEFDTWEVDGKKVPAGTEITVDKDTEVKAIWKKIQVKVTYDANGGSGNMEGETMDKVNKYTLLPNAFTAPDNTQEFKGWKIGEKEYQVGDEITVNENTTVTAQWAKKPDPNNPDDKPQNPPVNPGDKPRGFVPIPGGNTPNLKVIPGANPQILRVQPAPSASAPRVYKTLPRTGENNGLPLLASALLALLGGALILSRKRS